MHEADAEEWLADFPAATFILNLYENTIGRIYLNRRQCESESGLQEAVMKTWEAILVHYICSLYRLIPNRLVDIVESKDEMIDC